MFKHSAVIIIVFVGLFITIFGCPKASVQADACLQGTKRCCTFNAASCSEIGLTSYSAGDSSCQILWNNYAGKVCCQGARVNTPIYGRCKNDTDTITQTTDEKPPAPEKKLPKFSSLIKVGHEEFIGNIIKGLLGLTGTLTVIMMVYGGLLWMTAGGNEKAVGQAKQIILWTAVGLVLIFSSYTILKFLFNSLAN